MVSTSGTVKEMPALSPLLKTGLLVDLNNLYYGVQDRFGNDRRLMILEYVRFLEQSGHTLMYKVAYSRQAPRQVGGFLSMLKDNGFETNFAANHWNVSMALRAAEMVPNIDCLVIGSSHPEMGRILEWTRKHGKLTKCFSVNIPKYFRQWAETIEVTEGMLNAVTDATK